MNSYTNNGISISTYIIVSILEYKYSYKCMYTQKIIFKIYTYTIRKDYFQVQKNNARAKKCFCKLHKFLH